MEPIRTVAERIVARSAASTSKEDAVHAVYMNIWYLMDDVFALVKNINDTSLPGTDRNERIMELKTKYGLPVKHLL